LDVAVFSPKGPKPQFPWLRGFGKTPQVALIWGAAEVAFISPLFAAWSPVRQLGEMVSLGEDVQMGCI
jgi:hypothetical protein